MALVGSAMKIAHVCFWYYPSKVSGATVVVSELSKRQQASGHDVTVYTTRWGQDPFHDRIAGVPVKRFKNYGKRFLRNFVPGLLPELSRDVPDVIHAHAIWGHVPIAFLAAKLRGARFILQPHGTWLFLERRRPDEIYFRTAWPLIVRGADACLALNQDEMALLQRCGARQVYHVTNGVDLRKYCPGAGDYFSAQGETRCIVLFVGSIEHNKGVGTVLRSIPMVRANKPETLFVFVGAGQIEHYQALADDLGVGASALWLGPRFGAELVHIYQSANVVVVPSHYESFGNVIVEAMACAKPVVSSRVGGPREIICEGWDGLLIEPGDAAGLAKYLIRLLGDPELRQLMGQRGREKVVTRYDWDQINEAVMEIYATCH